VIGVAAWLCAGGAAYAQQEGRGSQPAAPATAKPAASELSFTTRLDRTAVWVGDQFHYQIFVDHSPRIQFILENVNRDTINLDPFRVVNVTSSTMTMKDGNRRLIVDLTLAAFVTGTAEIPIPQISLFYFRGEGATATNASEGAAAESLTVVGPTIGVRSTLPPRATQLRDAVTVSAWPRSRWAVAFIGWGALALLAVGLVWEGAQLLRGRRRKKGPDPRKAMAAIRNRWSQSVPNDFADPGTVMDFYGRSYADLKEYLGYLLETPTAGLMADEIRAEMRRVSASPDLTDRAGKVLDTCETARYARNPELNGTAARDVAADIRQIFEVSSL
jgi:hypothetical protein